MRVVWSSQVRSIGSRYDDPHRRVNVALGHNARTASPNPFPMAETLRPVPGRSGDMGAVAGKVCLLRRAECPILSTLYPRGIRSG